MSAMDEGVDVVMNDPRLKQIRIKTGVLKRAVKEKLMYEREVGEERARLEKMVQENRDQIEIKHQEEVINESMMMVPDAQNRIYAAYNDLKNLLQETESELNAAEEYVTAKACLDEVQIA